MEKLQKLLQIDLRRIDSELENLIPENNLVYSHLNFLLNGNSKKIRSILSLLYLKAQNKEITDEIIKILAAGEIIHNASLLHDDVIDDSEERRGDKSFYKIFTPHISILAGDYLLSLAIKKIMSLNNNLINEIFLDATKKMAEAEISQYENRGKDTSAKCYIDICDGKTSSLFAAILMSCAIISQMDINKAEMFGEKFGILFQIKNDLDPNSVLSDKKNGIRTAINIFGIEKTNALIDNYKKEIRSIFINCPNNEYKKGLEDLLEII